MAQDPGYRHDSGDKWQCMTCTKVSPKSSNLRKYSLANHYWRHHHQETTQQKETKPTTANSISCKACDIKTIDQKNLLDHLKQAHFTDRVNKVKHGEGALKCVHCKVVLLDLRFGNYYPFFLLAFLQSRIIVKRYCFIRQNQCSRHF